MNPRFLGIKILPNGNTLENHLEGFFAMKVTIFRKTAILTCTGLWLFTAFHFFLGEKAPQENIVTAFANASLMDVSSKAACFGKYGEAYMTREEKEQVLREAARGLAVSGYEVTTGREKEGEVTALVRNGSNGSALLKLITCEEKNGDGEIRIAQYLSMEVALEDSIPSTFAYKERMEKVLKTLKMEAVVNLYIAGSISGNLQLSARDAIADRMLGDIQAKVISENRDMECYSIYAYIRNVKEYAVIDNKRVNVNLSMNYDEAGGRTCIYLATPMNNQDF